MADVAGNPIGPALVDFSLHGAFPDEVVSSRGIAADDLSPALDSLVAAKTQLEAEIHTINEETASDVNQWVENAQSLENDINKTRSWANEIVRRSEAPDVSGQTIFQAEEKVNFLHREIIYNEQVSYALRSIKHVNELLDQVEAARNERRILDSLHLLEESWSAMDAIPVSKSCRIMRLLDIRAFELKSAVHDVFDHVWNSLVQVDPENGKLAILDRRQDEQVTLADAVVGLKAYKEVDQRMALVWHSIDQAIISPRTQRQGQELPNIRQDDSGLSLGERSDATVPALLTDLETVMKYLSDRLPDELIHSLSNVMMPDLVPRIISVWLDSAVPASLKEVDEFHLIIQAIRDFCNALENLKFSGFKELQEWAENIPRVWLAKCRETALDSVRSKLTQGLGDVKEIERVETQTVSQQESKELTANGTGMSGIDDAWDAAWDDGQPNTTTDKEPSTTAQDDDVSDAWGWGEEGGGPESEAPKASSNGEPPAEDEDPADAWGWGDDDDTAEPPSKESEVGPKTSLSKEQTREVTLKEVYHISSMPGPVLALISAILEDGASLIGANHNPMAPAAPGLFSLPTLVLAMFRAVSPYYYSLSDGGNMFLYNDASYLSEQLSDFSTNWKTRDDLAPRAIAMLRLDNDIKTLQSFAARAYSSEMSTQRTVLRDLLGGSQSLLQQDDMGSSEMEAQVDGAIAQIRSIAATWSGILSKSAWSQAVGSLVDTIASKIVADVMDLSGIGQDEAYNIANLIARITELDDLFIPPGAGKDAIPATAEYASSWLRLKYLSEVLQSNLQDVRYLWMESELSLYFTVDEVVELIGLSFVDNARTREVVREVEAHPHPLGQ
ncbi:hypothetical protein F4780DRAFT_60906 [Xylariomycetidae sp. FL0641]|nr:hypothetical protein F4780DRAFT_60906 [Xylariomycetidae sp. FL0641]